MRTVPSPLAIVTSCRPEIEDWHEASVGALVNSLTSVSIKEDVLVSFNLKCDSTTFRAISESKLFAATLPSNHKAGAALAQIFTVGNDSPIFSINSTQFLHRVNPERSKTSGTRHPPVVTFRNKAKGVSAMSFGFVCQLQSTTVHDDHVIVVGKLLSSEIYTGYHDDFVAHHHTDTPFQTSQATLPYIHGQYAHAHFDAGVNNCWKYDDKFLGMNFRHKPAALREEARAFYQGRLQLLERATRSLSQPLPEGDTLPRLSLAQIERYYEYYRQRHDQVVKRSQDSDHWQGEFVKEKSNLAIEAIQQEREIYKTRLSHIQKQVKTIESGLSNADRAVGLSSPDAGETIPEKLERLHDHADYFSIRLHLMDLVLQRRKSRLATAFGVHPETIQGVGAASRAATRQFISTQRGASVDDLRRAFHSYAETEAASRLQLLEAECRSDGADTTVVQQLRDRHAFASSRKAAVEVLLREQWAGLSPDAPNRQLSLPGDWTPFAGSVDKETADRQRRAERILSLLDD